MANRNIFIPPNRDQEDYEFLFDGGSVEFIGGLIAQAEAEDTASSSRRYVRRDRDAALQQLIKDYFTEDEPTYQEDTFRDRFGMSKRLFLKIVGDVEEHFDFFKEGYDARGKKSFTALQKCTAALKQLTTGNPPVEFDDYLKIARRTAAECLDHFCAAIVKLYGKEFLRKPTSHDIALLYSAHEYKHSLPGMIGSLDCTHIVWRNCPVELHGQYHRGDHEYPTIMLEAVASQDLWIWHAFCGMPGANNDINVLQQTTLFTTHHNGTAPKCPFEVNGRQYKRGYYLVDGIYPTWSVFVKSFPYPVIIKEKKFKKIHESARKDVERVFGVLKAKWRILARPNRSMRLPNIRNQIYSCIILHNMIIKDDGRAISPVYIRDPPVQPHVDEEFNSELHDSDTHIMLRYDLVEHVDRVVPDTILNDSP